MLPSLESLHCFCEAARLLNFRAASRAVALTPTALGQRIRQLEDQLDTPLFQRTTRRVMLTEAGLALLPHAHRTLDAARDCVRAGRGELGPPPMSLTVGTRHELGLSWLLPHVADLERAHPNLTLHLYFGSGADLLIRVRTGEIDCAIGSMRLDDPRLASARLHREEYVFVGGAKLLGATPLRRAEDAGRHTLLDTRPELPLYDYFRSAPDGGDRLKFQRTRMLGTIAAIHELVRAGRGVAVLPEYLVRDDLRAKRLLRVLPAVKLANDWFRLVFRTDDPRRSLYETIGRRLVEFPLR